MKNNDKSNQVNQVKQGASRNTMESIFQCIAGKRRQICLNYAISTKQKVRSSTIRFSIHQGAQVPQKHSSRLFKAFFFVSLGLLTSQLFIHSAYAASYVDVSSNGDGTSGSGVVRLGRISPSSTGTQATGSDTLIIHTDCAAGYKVYVSSQENQSTSLVNSNATTPENPSAKDLITAASNTLAEGVSPSTLSSNTWGINGNSTEAGNGLYYGLPSFENSTAFPLITMSNVAEESTVPIYYGVKVDTSINPGTYSGSVLYTVLINNSCLDYTVVFNPNVNSSSTSEITGTMSDQSIMYGETTALSPNAFSRSNYNFLGWSTSSTGKTGTVVNGVGTTADVDYEDEADVLNLVSGGGIVTLYAIWEEIIPTRISEMTTMQQMNSAICANSSIGENKVVTDVRDNSTYRINKLKDGNCWMVENLRITNKVLDSTTSDLADGTTFTVPASTKQAFTESFAGVTPRMALSDNTSYGGYYNFTAATAGTGNGYNQGTTSGTYSICPKGWTLPTKDNFVSLDKAFGYSGENRTGGTAQWNASYANTNYSAGYPGMALAGRYYSDYPNLYSGQSAAYWSSTTASTTHAYYLDFGTGSTYLYPQNQVSKFLGASVRCIVKPDTMQNLNCNTINTGTTVTLKDTRDEQDYTVYRFPNAGTAGSSYPSSMAGYCLMTKDLSLGYVTGGSMTKGEDLVLTADTSAAAGTITARTDKSNWSTTNSDDNLQYINGPKSGSEAYSSHSYYSFGAAQKVCPKGWRLPTQTQYNNIATFMGGNNSTGSSTIRSAPYNFVFGGGFGSGGWNDVGSEGYYWSSAQYSSASAYFLDFHSSNLYTYYSSKYNGISVRCISS
ncbi:InlB B-repeat-containing protein [Candidatus Saccharibacteria bacterium]|nr:InlB B-repeat-containing protein [Candidatus Saccharibacteria bacterium]